MSEATSWRRRLGRALAFAVLGLGGTGALAFGGLAVATPLQAPIYRLYYGWLGPSEAYQVAILGGFLVVALAALGVTVLVAAFLGRRAFGEPERNLRAVGVAVLGIEVLAVLFGIAVVAGAPPVLAALVVLVLAGVGVPVALRYQYDVRSGALPAFAGALPVLALLALLVAFGLGWGWGFVVIAEEAPPGSVDAADATFDDLPEVRDDLFSDSNCSTDSDGQRRCILQLRGYEHELATAQFLDRHGVRCPYEGGIEDGGTAIARHDGEYYRVGCTPHGD